MPIVKVQALRLAARNPVKTAGHRGTSREGHQLGFTLPKKATLAYASIQQWHHVAVRSNGRAGTVAA